MTEPEIQVAQFKWAAPADALRKKAEKGIIAVERDGSLTITPDDDYYWGKISREQAMTLALTILKHLLATLPPAQPSAP